MSDAREQMRSVFTLLARGDHSMGAVMMDALDAYLNVVMSPPPLNARAPAPEPHQSEGTGSEDAYPPAWPPDDDVLGQMEWVVNYGGMCERWKLADWLRRLRSRTEREAPDAEAIDAALRQAFRAGWWRRSQESALGATVEHRNRVEDADIPAIARRLRAPAPRVPE